MVLHSTFRLLAKFPSKMQSYTHDLCPLDLPFIPDTRLEGRNVCFEINGVKLLAVPIHYDLSPTIATRSGIFTIFHIDDNERFSLPVLQHHLLQYQNDDVFHKTFLNGIIFTMSDDSQLSCLPELKSFLMSLGTKWVGFFPQQASGVGPHTGPHMIMDKCLWRLFRLHDDTSSAFLTALLPNHGLTPNDSFHPLRISSEQPSMLSVAVAARPCLKSNGTLTGTRIAVKDLFHMHGLTNSLCNRAYLSINKPSGVTAECVTRLIDEGVQIVGITKLSSMISREEPKEAVDFQAPFNPRADGYQSPAGSSSGSAAAVASYEWLDFAIGTDTSGSGRRPALVNGVFQLRPSHDMISLAGIVQTFVDWDTPCVFGRDFARFPRLAMAWYNPPSILLTKTGKKPFILYPKDLAADQSEPQRHIVEAFVKDLERSLGTNACTTAIADLWAQSSPAEAEGQDLATYLEKVVVQTYYREYYDSFEEFRGRYETCFERKPYVNSFVSWRWKLGREVTDQERKEGLGRLGVYKSWFLREILQSDVQLPLLVLPLVKTQPNYRDTNPDPPTAQHGTDPIFLSPILGAPDVILPIGEVPYHSRVSQRQEYLPVGVNVIGAPGQDMFLLNAALYALQQSGRPTEVVTGPRIYPLSAERPNGSTS